MPPHWLQAGPRSRPARRAGTTGGVSVRASAAARVVAGWLPATPRTPGVPAVAAGLSAAGASDADVVAEEEAEPAAAGPELVAPPVAPLVPCPPFDGPAVSDPIDIAASSAILRARTSGVRIPSS